MKETYYFQHDYNPTNDPKITCLIGNYGGLGYGIFWRIIELLHQEETHKLPNKLYIYEAIAKQMLTSAEQIETLIDDCIKKYELFESDTNFFWSNRVLFNIGKRQEISEKRSIAGKHGAEIRHQQAIAKQNQAKERKGKERKYNNSDESPLKNSWQYEALEAIKILDAKKKSSIFKCFKNNPQRAKTALNDCKELGKTNELYFFKVFNEIIK